MDKYYHTVDLFDPRTGSRACQATDLEDEAYAVLDIANVLTLNNQTSDLQENDTLNMYVNYGASVSEVSKSTANPMIN